MNRSNPGWSALVVALAAAGGAATVVSDARAAETGGVAVAEVLFRDGRQLLAGKDYEHACPKLAESFRLDPATGTLLAMAICHERQGKLASAWGEYADVAERAHIEARRDRERAARSKVAELEPRLSTLTIVVPESLLAAGAEIRRNGSVVAPAWLGSAVPVDGGAITVEVGLPGKRAWRAEVPMMPTGDRRILVVPTSDDGASAAPAGAPSLSQAPANVPLAPPAAVAPASDVEVQVEAAAKPVAEATPEPPPPTPSDGSSDIHAPLAHAANDPAAARGELSPLAVTGTVVGVLGVLGLALATTSAVAAMSRNDASKSQCYGDLCTPAGKQERRQALTYGDLATGGFVGSGLLVAAGVALYVWGRHGVTPADAPGRSSLLHLLPTAGPGGIGGSVQGQF